MKGFCIAVLLCLALPAVAAAQTEMESRLIQMKHQPPGVNVGHFGGGEDQFVPIEPSATCKEYRFQLGGKAVLGKDGFVHLHIKRAMKTTVRFDQVMLDVGGEKLRPIRAVADGHDVTKKLASADNKDVSFQELDLTFPAPSDPKALEGCAIMFVAAAGSEEESVVPPTSNKAPEFVQTSKFSDYTLGSRRGTLSLDGRLTPEEQLGKPLFKEKVKDAGGQQQRMIHVWAMDDGEFLSVAMDVMADVTIDEGDRAILYVREQGPSEVFP